MLDRLRASGLNSAYRADSASSTLSYTAGTRALAPIPAAERDLPSAIAEPYFKVSDGDVALEGPAFDREGNLLFVDVLGGRVLHLTPDRRLTTVYTEVNLHPAGIAVHKDGRIFVASLGTINPKTGQFDAGSVIALDSTGANRTVIVPASAGYVVDDMVFDREGGFYFTDFRGTSTEATGGLFYVTPDHQTIKPIVPRMCAANGVALSPDEQVLWATEYRANRLHRLEISSPGVLARGGATTPYTFVGRAPDSMRTDLAGNAYVAMNWQGRVLVFSPYGIPIGQILLPGREENLYLKSTSLALVPNSRDLVIVAQDVVGGKGAMIFSARGLAPGFPMFSHQ